MADPASHIDQGSLSVIFKTGAKLQPVLQCVQVKPVPSVNGNPERMRVVFSDVQNFAQSIVALTLNHLVHDGIMQVGCLCRLLDYETNSLKGKSVLIVKKLEVLAEYGVHPKIGAPVVLPPMEGEGQEGQNGAPAPMSGSNFYGSKPETKPAPQNQPARSFGGASASHANIHPIESLSPYAHKWTIKARVTSKSEIKTWHNKNGEGKLFSVNLLDESGEIKATAFQDQCDALYEVFEEGSVYYITSPCRVQFAKKQFSNVNNDYELTFERDTQVEKAEEQSGVPQIRFNFVKIGDLANVEKDAVIDTIGVLKEVAEVSQITSKTTSKPYDKRELTLVDNTSYSVRVTIWGNAATTFDVPIDSVLAFKGVKVSDFGGRSLSLLSSGTMSTNPDIDDAHRLKGWYDAQGSSDTFSTHASLGAAANPSRKDDSKTISQVKEEQLGMSDTTDYFSLRATIIYIRQENVAYPACQSPDCNKKVLESDDGWRCEKCNKSFDKPQWRYIMSMNVADHTGQTWLSCFDDTGKLMMGMSADELMELKDSGDEAAFRDVFLKATWQTLSFRCRAKMDNYNEQQRVRYQVSAASVPNYGVEAAKLMEKIKLYD